MCLGFYAWCPATAWSSICQKEKPSTMTGKRPFRQQEPKQGPVSRAGSILRFSRSRLENVNLRRSYSSSPSHSLRNGFLSTTWKSLWGGWNHWPWAQHLPCSRKAVGTSSLRMASDTRAKLFSSLNPLSFNWPLCSSWYLSLHWCKDNPGWSSWPGPPWT